MCYIIKGNPRIGEHTSVFGGMGMVSAYPAFHFVAAAYIVLI